MIHPFELVNAQNTTIDSTCHNLNIYCEFQHSLIQPTTRPNAHEATKMARTVPNRAQPSGAMQARPPDGVLNTL